jgi:glucose/mannose-6-phosphate isomerase
MVLDDLEKIKKLDSSRVVESIKLLPDQMRQVFSDAYLIKIPRLYTRVTQVVVNGMGGSNLGAKLVKAAWADQIKVPITISPGYNLPAHVNKNTLYIISSYSGNTEEPLSTYREAKKRGAKIIAITAEGKKNKLSQLMLRENIPGYIFTPRFNPSAQPRLGLGYAVLGLVVLLLKTGLLKIKKKEIKEIIDWLEINSRKLKPESPLAVNPAKKLATKLADKIPVLVGAEFTAGNVHILRNQINENAKQFATYLILPDLNHYAMEGLAHPVTNQKNLIFLFFNSSLYSPRVCLRANLTEKIVIKNGLEAISYNFKNQTKIAQVFELLQLGTWLSFYLGILNNVDPAKIPWVDWFKEQLAKK